MRQFTLTFKALALNAQNCGADAVWAFMRRNDISWYNHALPDNVHPELTLHRELVYNKTLWVIYGVDINAGTFQIQSPTNKANVMVVSIDDESYRLL